MTGDQCRKARERRDWTRHQPATATDVPLWFIAAFEDGKATPDFLAGQEIDLRVALEEPRWGGGVPRVGVHFSNDRPEASRN